MLGYQAVGAVRETVGAVGDAVGAAFQPANSDLLADIGGVGASSAGLFDTAYGLLFPDEAEAENEALGIEAEEEPPTVGLRHDGGSGVDIPVGQDETVGIQTLASDVDGVRTRGVQLAGGTERTIRGHEVGASAEVSATAGISGTIAPRGDGRYDVAGALRGDVAGSGAATFDGLGGDGALAAGRERRAGAVFTPAEVERARQIAGGDERKAVQVLLADRLLLDADIRGLAPGESVGQTVDATAGGGLGLKAVKGGAKGSAGSSWDVARAEDGSWQVDVGAQLGASGEAGVGVGLFGVGAEVGGSAGMAQEFGVQVTLPDGVDPALVERIATANTPWQAATLARLAGGEVVPTHSTTTATGTEEGIAFLGGAYGKQNEGTRTRGQEGEVQKEAATWSETLGLDLLGVDLLEDEEKASVAGEIDGEDVTLDLEHERARKGLGWDGVDWSIPLDRPKELLLSAVTSDATSVDAYRLQDDQVDALIQTATEGQRDLFFAGERATNARSEAMFTELALLDGLEPAERRRRALEIVADFTAAGGNHGDLQRMAVNAGAKRWEWPATIEGGPERFEGLQASIDELEAGGDPAGLDADLDRMFMEMQRAEGFTMPQARADMLERVDELRARAFAARMKTTTDPEGREELELNRQFQQGWTDLAVLRALKADEAAVLSQADSRTYNLSEARVATYYTRMRERRSSAQSAGAANVDDTLPSWEDVLETGDRLDRCDDRDGFFARDVVSIDEQREMGVAR